MLEILAKNMKNSLALNRFFIYQSFGGQFNLWKGMQAITCVMVGNKGM